MNAQAVNPAETRARRFGKIRGQKNYERIRNFLKKSA